MNAPNRPPMPPQPTTKQIPAVSVPANTLDAVLTEVRALRGDVQVAVEQGQSNGKALGELSERVARLEDRAATASMRAQAPSSHDLETAKALAQEVEARQALDKKVTNIAAETAAQTVMIQSLIDGAKTLAKNPTVHTIAVLLGALIIAWLKGHLP